MSTTLYFFAFVWLILNAILDVLLVGIARFVAEMCSTRCVVNMAHLP